MEAVGMRSMKKEKWSVASNFPVPRKLPMTGMGANPHILQQGLFCICFMLSYRIWAKRFEMWFTFPSDAFFRNIERSTQERGVASVPGGFFFL